VRLGSNGLNACAAILLLSVAGIALLTSAGTAAGGSGCSLLYYSCLNCYAADTGATDTTALGYTVTVYATEAKYWTVRAPIAGASVYLDGQLVGTTDAQGALVILGVSLGRHGIRIEKEGYIRFSTTIYVARNVTVTVFLTTTSATITIDTKPTFRGGVPIQVDGGRYYSTPFSLNLEKKGTHTFYAPLQPSYYTNYVFYRWEDETGTVISTSQSLTYNVQSEKTFYAVYQSSGQTGSTLTLSVTDLSSGRPIYGATVYLDGTQKGTTDFSGRLVITGVSRGSHTITVKKTGYQDGSQWVYVQHDMTVAVGLLRR
jgi:hypothetical protein